MDRLQIVIALALVAAACSDDDAPTVVMPSRVVAVEAEPEADPALEFCEAAPSADAAPTLGLPALASGSFEAGRVRRWVNVWATWCRPCVEEMPMLVEWRDRLRADGVDVELVFVSADETEEEVASFRSEHPSLPETIRIADRSTLGEWAPTVGLDAGATLPIHLLGDARGKVRCARTGAVRERDYETVKTIFARM